TAGSNNRNCSAGKEKAMSAQAKKLSPFVFILAVILLVSAAPAFGQEKQSGSPVAEAGSLQPEALKDEVSRLLQSGDIKDQAWGAYLIGKYRLTEFISLLPNLLNPVSQTEPAGAGYLRRAIFDTLIQMEGVASSDILMPLYKNYPDEVLILLAKSPRD